MKKDAKKEDVRNYGFGGVLFDSVSIIVTAITLLAVVFTFGFRMVGVNGSSMDNTLKTGDWLVVTPYFDEPQYGDIVISTKETAADGALVKRVIAVAGDVVDVHEDDSVYVNGIKLDETYALTQNTYGRGDRTYPLTVPEGCVMLMGDNRTVSWDSRYSNIGFIEKDFLLGKARLRLDADWDIYKNFTHNALKD
jgi:signal peptidase I